MLCCERLLLLPSHGPRPDSASPPTRSLDLLPPRRIHPAKTPSHLHVLLHGPPPDNTPRSCSIHVMPTKCPDLIFLEHLPSSHESAICPSNNPLSFVKQPLPLDDAEEEALPHQPRDVMEVSYEESIGGDNHHPIDAALGLEAGSYDRRIVEIPARGNEGIEEDRCRCSESDEDDAHDVPYWSVRGGLQANAAVSSPFGLEAEDAVALVTSTGKLDARGNAVVVVESEHLENLRSSQAENLSREQGTHLNGFVIDRQCFQVKDLVHHMAAAAGCSLMNASGSSQINSDMAHEGQQEKETMDPTTEKVKSAPSTSACTDAMMMIRMPTYRTPLSGVSETIMFLESLGADCSRIFREDPTAATDCEVQELRELVSALEGYGLKWNELGRIFNLCPRILHLRSITLQSVASFLFHEVGLRPRDFSKVIKRCPRLLTCSIDEQLRPTLHFLQSLGFRNMGQVVSNNATLLSFSVEKKIIPKLNYLESLGFAPHEVVSMVIRFPAIFNYSAKENLQPKFDYLVKVMGRRNRDLLSFPQYFGFSLERKIRPRFECIARRGASLSLQAMLKISDAEFAANFECINVTGKASKDAFPLAGATAKLPALRSFCSASSNHSVNARDETTLLFEANRTWSLTAEA